MKHYTFFTILLETAYMVYPEGLGPFDTDVQMGNSRDRIRELRLDWPKVDVLELDQGQLSL